MDNLNHDKISPTAKLVAYFRQFSDIPYSKDVALLFKTKEVFKEVFNFESSDKPQKDIMAPLLELRYKCVQNLIEKNNIKQVLEFASGISLRGLAMTSDPHMIYIESDLPELTKEKISLTKNIMNIYNINERKNLFFHNINILNYKEIEPALQHFDHKKPLAIIHEGLFHYLTKDEKKIAAKNIYKILSQFNGIWITPDLDIKAHRHHPLFDRKKFANFSQVIKQTTGRSFEDNAFSTLDEIRSFFNELGFRVEYKSQISDDIELSSLKNTPNKMDVIKALQPLTLFVLTIRS